jgi:hypothetical protein
MAMVFVASRLPHIVDTAKRSENHALLAPQFRVR